MTNHRVATAAAVVLSCLLVACGGGKPTASESPSPPSPSAGQVAGPAAASRVSFYAASRFAEQVSFGATPALVAEVQAKGYEKWIDDQFALPIVPIDIKPAPGTLRPRDAVDLGIEADVLDRRDQVAAVRAA